MKHTPRIGQTVGTGAIILACSNDVVLAFQEDGSKREWIVWNVHYGGAEGQPAVGNGSYFMTSSRKPAEAVKEYSKALEHFAERLQRSINHYVHNANAQSLTTAAVSELEDFADRITPALMEV